MRLIILAVLMCVCQAALGPENCRSPQLQNNGFFVPNSENYRTGDKIAYGCNTGLKPDLKTWWGEITCKNGEWSPTPQCIDAVWCVTTHVPNAKPDVLQASRPGKYDFECDHGYWIGGGKATAECVAGSWTLPECKQKPDSCAPPPRVHNGLITTPYRNIFENGEKLEYICARGYRLVGDKTSICERGLWSSNPSCVEVKCIDQPYVAYARATERFKLSYNHGDTVRFICNRGYQFEGTDTARCEDGTWKLPVCKVEVKCTVQPYVAYARATERFKLSYNHGDTVRFICNRSYQFEGTDTARCEDGTWKLPVCKVEVKCTDQPYVAYARATEGFKLSYNHGDTVRLICKRGYQFEGTDTARCEDGTWKLPVCKVEVKCTVQPYVAYARATERFKLSYNHGDTVRFICDRDYEFEGTDTARCEDGTWKLPVCKGAGGGGGAEHLHPDQFGVLQPVSVCGSHPLITNGDVIELPSGKELKVQCARLYKLDGPRTVGCVKGEWTPLPVCKPPCKVEGERIHSGQSDEYLQEGEEKRYNCDVLRKITVRCLRGTPVYSECKWNL